MEVSSEKNKILLHTCCAPCATYVFEKLKDDGFEVNSYFYNPNIHPDEEYEKRLNELKYFCKQNETELIIKENDTDEWFKITEGLENEPEGGARCFACYRFRLEQTAKYAKENGYDYFSTVLTISPHKNATEINKIGKELEEKYKIAFLEENFKKKDGFKKSLELSKKYDLFRQDYCGCVYSIRNK